MSNLPETEDYADGTYQIETSDRIIGGPGGIANKQAEQLGNRTAWLKAALTKIIDGTTSIGKAARLATARTLRFKGAVSGSGTYDGSADTEITLTLADSGIAAGAYTKVEFNVKGIAVSGSNPDTLAAAGIKDAYTVTQTNNLLNQRVAADSIVSAGVVSGDPNLPYFLFRKPDGTVGHIINLSLSSHGHTFESLTAKPTTRDGYGLTDVYTSSTTDKLLNQRVAADAIIAAGVVSGDPNLPYFRFMKPDGTAGHIINLSLSSHGHTFASLTAKPTTRDGYALTDVFTASETRAGFVASGSQNRITLSWAAEGLKAAVDVTDLGALWLSSNFNPETKADKSNTYTTGQTDVRLAQRIVSDWISHAGLVSDNPDLPYFMQASTGNILQLARRVHRHAFSDLDGLPNTAVGHGIYDVYSVSQSDVRLNQKLTRDAISVAGLWGGDINLPYFRRAVDEQPVYFITQTTLPKNTCQKGIPGWWKCADTGLLRQRVSIFIGDVSTAWAGAVTWPVAFPGQADSVKLSFLHTNGSPATVSCAYADLTRTGCNLRVDEWGLNPQYGLTLIVEAEGY